MKHRAFFRISSLVLIASLLLSAFGLTAGALRGGDKFDNNGDGVVDISDVTASLNYLAGGEGSVSVFDDNGDGIVDISDVTALLNHLAGSCDHKPVTDEGYPAFCMTPGLSDGSHCSECGRVLVPQEVIPALGHHFVDGYCTRCNRPESTPGLVFEQNGESYTVTGYTGTDTVVIIPETYEGLPVTAIGTEAFEYQTIVSVDIPESVTTVGAFAFQHCGQLRTATLREGLETISAYAFARCYSLESLELPKSVRTLDSGAFAACTGIESVTVPEGVTVLGSGCFSHCTALYDVTLPTTLYDVSDNAFSYCASLEHIDLPSGLTLLGWEAFSNCVKLRSIVIPDGVAVIPYSAFASCTLLRSVTTPANLTAIGECAFEYCPSLVSITLPEGVVEIGYCAFNYCISLAEVVNNSALTITPEDEGNGAVAYYAIDVHPGRSRIINENSLLFLPTDGGNYLVGCDGSLKDLVLPSTFSGQPYTLHECCFYMQSELRSVVIPDEITVIPKRAFYGCFALESVVLPSLLTDIGAYAFYECYQLVSITVPPYVETIGSFAFYDCRRLAEVVDNSALPIERGGDSFGYIAKNALDVRTGFSAIENVDGYLFLTAADGTNYLVGYRGSDTVLTLPADYHGETYEIAPRVFFGCSELTGVTIPSGVTGIGREAFNCCDSIKRVVIHEGTESFGAGVFENCTSLAEIRLPATLTGIGNASFYGCGALCFVYYAGSESDWEKIWIGYDNSCLTAAGFVFNA